MFQSSSQSSSLNLAHSMLSPSPSPSSSSAGKNLLHSEYSAWDMDACSTKWFTRSNVCLAAYQWVSIINTKIIIIIDRYLWSNWSPNPWCPAHYKNNQKKIYKACKSSVTGVSFRMDSCLLDLTLVSWIPCKAQNHNSLSFPIQWYQKDFLISRSLWSVPQMLLLSVSVSSMIRRIFLLRHTSIAWTSTSFPASAKIWTGAVNNLLNM